MSRSKFDPSKVKIQFGKLYYEGEQLGSHRERQYKQWLRGQNGGAVKGRATFPKQYGKYFSAGTKFTTRQGHLASWAKPMALRGGANSNYNWSRVNYLDFNGGVHKASSSGRWGSDINQGKRGSGGSATVLHGTKQWIRQIQISLYALRVQSENFRVVVGRRAMKVFQNSFKYQQFYSSRSRAWASLAPYTLKKRASRGTGSRILKEYGDLYNSIKMDEHAGVMTSRIYTDIVPSNAAHHKKHSICYAGYHNEGKGTYGSGWNGHKPKPYIKRQFMGHSSYLNPFTDSFMRKMMKLYLFDSVFLVKKT